MPRYAHYDRTRGRVAVPADIRFSTSCLAVPTLEEAGIPRLLAKVPILEPTVGIGDWVERDQTLLVARLPVFDRAEPPSRWTPWLEDSFSYLQCDLSSPVAGLVVNTLESYGAYHGEARATNSGLSLCYGEWAARPVLLIPAGEPPAHHWSSAFFHGIARLLCDNRSRLLYSHREGYRRLSSVLGEFERSDVAQVETFCGEARPQLPVIRPVGVADIGGTEGLIQELRAHAHDLRNRLQHIGGAVA